MKNSENKINLKQTNDQDDDVNNLNSEGILSAEIYNPGKYSTLLIGGNKKGKHQKVDHKNLCKFLKSENREEKEIVLALLKSENAQAALVEAILTLEDSADKAVLIAACWESGLDFSAFFLDFIQIAVESNELRVVLECCTLLQESELKISHELLEQGIAELSEEIALKNEKMILLSDLKMYLMDNKMSKLSENENQ